MRSFLLWSLYGPLQSWGQHAVGEVRQTNAVPTKSAVLGMIAAALGIDRLDPLGHEQLHRDLGFAVWVLQHGHLERDFHTVQMPKQQRGINHHTRKDELRDSHLLNTLISRRDYRGDAFHLVAIWQRNSEAALEKIAAALKQPHYSLSLGRRSCVTALPMDPQCLRTATLKDAFLAYQHKPPAQRLLPKPGAACQVVWDTMDQPGLQPVQVETRRDRVGQRAAWTFLNRQQAVGSLAFPMPQTS